MRIPIAAAALVRGGRVLLGHRHPSRRWYPDCWDLVGGHVEPGETAAEALIRECREEIGVLVRDPAPMGWTSSDPTLELHAFVVRRWDGEPSNVAPDEHDELRWFSPAELAGLRYADPACLPFLLDVLRAAPGADVL